MGWPDFQAKIPNGAKVHRDGEPWPGVGHSNASGGPGGEGNPFGQAFKNAGLQWTAELCALDSDGDGQSNGVELGDPDCQWSEGGTPNRTSGISHPGYADSKFCETAAECGVQTASWAARAATPASAALFSVVASVLAALVV